MIIFCTQSLVSYSVIIREAPFLSKWEQTKRPTGSHLAEQQILYTQFWIEYLNEILPLRAQGTYWKMRQKEYKNQSEHRTPGEQNPLN